MPKRSEANGPLEPLATVSLNELAVSRERRREGDRHSAHARNSSSNRSDESNSNWSSLLSVWDYLHGAIRLDVPQASATIGVPAYSHEEDVMLGKVLVLPSRRERKDWLFTT